MNNAIFTLDQNAATKAGGGEYISETGYYFGQIDSAEYVVAGTGTFGLELSISTDGGKANYLTMYYAKSDNTTINGGSNMIQAIMALTGCQNLTMMQQNTPQGVVNIAPELTGKQIGFVLQKVLYTKSDGSEGHKFQIVTVANQQKQTAKEMFEQKQAAKVDLILSTLKDKDERKPVNQSGPAGGFNPATNNF